MIAYHQATVYTFCAFTLRERRRNMQNPTQAGDNSKATFTRGHFVMAEKDALMALARMTAKKPRAAALLTFLMSQMERGVDAIVINQKLIAKMMGISPRTVQYAIGDLVEWRWVQVVHLHGPGAVAAYRINSNVAWVESRDQLWTSKFNATIVADFSDQPKAESTPLMVVPEMFLENSADPFDPPPADPHPPSEDSRQISMFEEHA